MAKYETHNMQKRNEIKKKKSKENFKNLDIFRKKNAIENLGKLKQLITKLRALLWNKLSTIETIGKRLWALLRYSIWVLRINIYKIENYRF